MRAVITVAGKDRVGIIASVTQTLAQQNVNVLDITQTILPPDFFTLFALGGLAVWCLMPGRDPKEKRQDDRH